MKLQLAVGEATVEFTVRRAGDRLALTDAQGVLHEVELLRQDADGLELRVGGRRRRLVGAELGQEQHVWVDGRHWRVRRLQAGAAAEAADPGALCATIPAVVGEVRVTPGEAVRAGDKLVLLESMKMVLAVQAPRDGVVRAVHCAAGESVEAGAPLVELE